MLTAQSLEICKNDDSVASTSASEAVNQVDGLWVPASSSGSVDHETDLSRQHAAKESLSSSTIMPARDSVACELAIASGDTSGICAEPCVPAESLCAVQHKNNAESVQTCKEDGSLASTSATATVKEQDGSWDPSSVSVFVPPGTDFIMRHAVQASVSSSIDALADDSVACKFAIAPGVASRTRAAPYMAPEPLGAVLHWSDAQNLAEFATSQIRKEDGSLHSTSASGIVNREDGSLAVSSASGIVSHEAALDLEEAIVSKDDGRVLKVSDAAAAEHQVSSAAPLAPTPGNTSPKAGVVPQRPTECAERYQGLTEPSFSAADCMPQRGLVPQRIQQFQSFIDRL
jgi:hypothetical protein